MKTIKNLMIITVIVSILLTFGCSKGGGGGSAAINNTPVEQIDPNVLAITNSTPDRSMIKEVIKNEVIKKVNEVEKNNKAPRKATGDTTEVYFALSKSTVEINENSATNKYRFLYQDHTGEWTGELIFLFSKDGNDNWINTDYGVVFKSVDLCLVKGNIINNVTGKPMEGVVVYGLSGSEGTRVKETDPDGSFIFDDIFDGDYVFHFVNSGFKKEKTETITVVSGGTNEIETVYMTPDENERFATVEGTAYYDNEKTRPVDDGVVYLLYTDGSTTDIKPVMTDQNGEYRLRFVSPGLYDLRCKYGDLVSGQNVITIEENSADDLKVVTGKDIVIGSNNFPPTLVSYSPTEETIEVQVGDKIDFKVEVQDPDNDKITYS